MKLLYAHSTRLGPVHIGQSADARFHVLWKGDPLGSYHTAAQAADDAAGDHTYPPPDGTDLGSLHISPEITAWTSLRTDSS
jgi:hypothetical protein